jgi:threonine dehydrogenase-like Zn-dependent dehydrogenase
MRAAIMRGKKLVVDELPNPEPGPGQVLVKTLACGICGSDLHMLKFADRMVEVGERTGAPSIMDLSRDIVMGHEFCAEILDHGPNTSKNLQAGARVCSMPIAFGPSGISAVGYSNNTPGGYGEQMVLNEMMLLEVPNGLSTEHAALTEPMAVGWHAVAKSNLEPNDVPIVIGCGPVGLAVIAGLKLRGAGPIIAADFSPARRAFAEKMGADIIVDPSEHSPYTKWEEVAIPDGVDLSNPMTAMMMGMSGQIRPGIVFECVGTPGVIQQILEGAPRGARVVVAGVCMEADRIEPIFAINKELNVQFVVAYSPTEFSETLHHIAEGEIDVAPLITDTVGVDGVAGAFEELATPDRHAKILVEPWR